MRLVFVDTETTGLDPTTHVPWDVAVIEEDGFEHVWTWRPSAHDLDQAQPKALEVGRFHERVPAYAGQDAEFRAAEQVAAVLADTQLVGQNPDFDWRMLANWLGNWGHTLDVHYRKIDLLAMSAGWVHGFHQASAEWSAAEGSDMPTLPEWAKQQPWSSYRLSELVGVDPPGGDDAHTALGDARWVRRMWLTMTGGQGGS